MQSEQEQRVTESLRRVSRKEGRGGILAASAVKETRGIAGMTLAGGGLYFNPDELEACSDAVLDSKVSRAVERQRERFKNRKTEARIA